MKNPLIQFGNTPVEFAAVASLFPNNKYKHNKISSLEKRGDLIRLKQGLYVVHPDVSQKSLSLFLIGNHLYGPSYISLQSALRHYGLIPEQVFTICSMTTKPSQNFRNSMAWFEYVHTDETVFPIGLREEATASGASILMASPEKALCDLIADIAHLNLRYRKEILVWLEEDIRFDMDEFFHFDTGILREYAKVGKKKTMINQLIKIIEHEHHF